MLVKACISFIAATGFGVIFNAPLQLLIFCGFAGMTGWTVSTWTRMYVIDDLMLSSFIGAFAVSIIAHLFARRFKTPMITFSVAGIIPLVPGTVAYNAMRHVVESDYTMAIQLGSQAFLISGSVAMGLVFAEVIMQMVFRSKIHIPMR